MAIEPKQPNSDYDVNNVSRSIDYIADGLETPVSVQQILNLTTTQLGKQKGVQIRPMLTEMVDNIDLPILKNMALDVTSTLSSWFESPQLLCCLIQGLYTSYAVTAVWTKDNVTLADTDFGVYLDIMIAFVDLIIIMLSSNIKKLALAIPDFIAEIMSGVLGAILLILQEILFTIRDSIIGMIMEEFEWRTRNFPEITKCLPLIELINILKKYINDYGMFAELVEKLKGFIGGKIASWKFFKGLDFPKNIKDLEFLYWFRDLLVKLKSAALSFDLCFLPQTAATPDLVQSPPISSITSDFVTEQPESTGLSKRGHPSETQGITVASDGTILEDKASLSKEGTIPVLTSSSIRGFLNKYYGYPLDVVDSLVFGSSSVDSTLGTLSTNPNLNADCPNSPDPATTIQWALRVKNRTI